MRDIQAKHCDSLWIFCELICLEISHILFWSLHSYRLPRALHRKWKTGLYYVWISKIYLGFVQRKGNRALFSHTHYQLLHSTVFLLRESQISLEYVGWSVGRSLVAKSNRMLAFNFFFSQKFHILFILLGSDFWKLKSSRWLIF